MIFLALNMSDDDTKRQRGSEKGFMCGVCEGQLIIQAFFAKRYISTSCAFAYLVAGVIYLTVSVNTTWICVYSHSGEL